MKNIVITVITIFSILNLYAQTGGIEVYAKSNCSQSNSSVFVIDIFLKTENAIEDINLGGQNYRFSYNQQALANPTINYTNSDLNFGNIVFSGNGNNNAVFSYPTLNGSEPGILSLNTDMEGNGYNLNHTLVTYVCSVEFDVINVTAPINFNWHDSKFPYTFFTSYNNELVLVPGIFYDDLQTTVQDNFNTAPSVSDFNRSVTHTCNIDDGAISVTWNSNLYNDIYVNIDGGTTYNPTNGGSFSASNLNFGNYDIRVKQGENGCPVTLDDANILDLSHEVTRAWGHPTCGQDDGWIELTWVKKLNKIDISIDGGITYVENIPAANEYYRFDDLTTGNYDVRVRWTWNAYECPVKLDDVNLGVKPTVNTDFNVSYDCVDNLQLIHSDIGANRYQFRYRTYSNGVWGVWKNSSHTPNLTNTISNLPNVTKVKVRSRVYCSNKWSGWGQIRHFNLPACKLANNIDEVLMSVQPNPANQLVSVDIAGNITEGSLVSIYDVAGKQVQTSALVAKQKSIQLNVEDLTNGIYLIKVISGNKTHTQKLTIAH